MELNYSALMRFGNYAEVVMGYSPNFKLGEYVFQKINPRDKVSRGKGLTTSEGCAYQGICDLGTDAMLLCYANNCSFSESFSHLEMKVMCSTCEHCACDIKITDSLGFSLFSPEYIKVYANEEIEQVNPKSFVYFISDGVFIKIGKGANPRKRLLELQTGNARKLNLLYLIPCKNDTAAFRVERMLHENFEKYRLSGEWFEIKDKLMNSLYEAEFSESYYPNIE